MERLTKYLASGVAAYDYPESPNCFCDRVSKSAYRQRCVERLASYEDAGLTPEEVMAMRYTLDEYHKSADPLLKAQADGRVVVLPCKVGDTVYWIHNKTITRCRMYRVQKNRKGIFICLRGDGKSYGAFRADLTIGKTIFLTREEAEEALRGLRMAEYIERDEAIRIAERYGTTYGSALGRHFGVADCIASEISGLPSADVAPVVHGRWVNGNAICPVCGKDKFKDLDADIWCDWKPAYCLNCGAKMDGGVDDEAD